MQLRFCPYHGCEEDESVFTREHVVPFAIGGSNQFMIQVCEACNSHCGTEVDALLTNNFFIASERIARDLRGQSGNSAKWIFKGTTNLEGRAVETKYTVSTKELRLWTQPLVSRKKVDDQEEIRIECEENDLERILKDLNKKLIRDGRSQIEQEAFVQAARSSIATPSMQVSDTFNVRSFERPFIKMAIGAAHHVFGELFSRTNDADRLRVALWEPDPVQRDKLELGGFVWPNVPASPVTSELLRSKDHHTVLMLNTGPLSVTVNLFGMYLGTVLLSNDTAKYAAIVPEGSGVVFIIDPLLRALRSMTLVEFQREKQAELERFALKP